MIYIIRHGQTDLNRMNLLQGRSDEPLNEEGRLQAEQLKGFFDSEGITFTHVFSSPLIRAMQTARIASGREDMRSDERLLEMDYGPYEGTDLKAIPPELLHFFMDFVNNPAPEGMERLDDVVKRSGSFLEDIREAAQQGNILVSTHAVAMKGLLEYLTPDSNGSYWSKNIGNCAVFAVEVSDEGFSIPKEIY